MDLQFSFSDTAWKNNEERLVNQIFKMLPAYEKKEDWKKQYSTVFLELHGYNMIFKDNSNYMQLIAKMTSLENAKDHATFRKIIFEVITALRAVALEK